ncbi:alpha/beta fold hydrolase [Uliginosibacterium gangwonense]|uniref:alpha/beta fold hydrolase n=1 Tax=Uliginosibacterium gangwonense TaxID=392736 RepID=UPI00036B04EA|nr:alpha/beta fold hydrolase [Uliginosibacterium gangwonense]
MTANLVLLHGWGYRPNVWQPLIDRLPGYSIQTPALSPQTPDIAVWADELAATLPEHSVLIGWSLGAMLALSLAQRHPEKLAGLFLIGASPCFVALEEWEHGLAPAIVSQFQTDFACNTARTLKRFLALQVMGEQDRPGLQKILEPCLAQDEINTTALQTGLQILAATDLRRKLPTQPIPCTLLHGAQDALMPLAAAQYLHAHLPSSRLIVEDNAGHAPLFAKPEALAALIHEVCLAAS